MEQNGQPVCPPSHVNSFVPSLCTIVEAAGDSAVDSLLSRISITPGLRSGQPCIRDLRITVWDVQFCSSSRKGLPVFFSFASRRAVQSQSRQAQGAEPFSSRHLRRSWASCTFTSSKYSSQ